MKKAKYLIIGCLTLTLLISCGGKKSSAQKESYKEPEPRTYEQCMADAIESQTVRGNIVETLANYYDAMEANPTTDAFEAYTYFLDIKDKLKNGEYCSDSEFALHDEQKKYYEQFLQYYSQRCPYVFNFYKAERVNTNNERRTADYQIKFDWRASPKYKEILNCIEDYGSNLTTKYSKVGFKDFNSSSDISNYENIYMAWSSNETPIVSVPAVIATEYVGDKKSYVEAYGLFNNEFPLYVFDLAIYARGTDNLLYTLRGIRFSTKFSNPCVIEIEDVPENALKYFDSTEIDIKPTNIQIMYGDISVDAKKKAIEYNNLLKAVYGIQFDSNLKDTLLYDYYFPKKAKYKPVSASEVHFYNRGARNSDKGNISILDQLEKPMAQKLLEVENQKKIAEGRFYSVYLDEMEGRVENPEPIVDEIIRYAKKGYGSGAYYDMEKWLWMYKDHGISHEHFVLKELTEDEAKTFVALVEQNGGAAHYVNTNEPADTTQE